MVAGLFGLPIVCGLLSIACTVQSETALPQADLEAEAVQQWTRCDTAGCSQLLLAIDFADSSVGVAVGGSTERGAAVILRTADGGKTWAPIDTDARGRLYDVEFTTPARGYAVGFGVLLETRDAGITWSSRDLLADRWLASVAFASASTGFIAGGVEENPVLWKTTDAGRNWKSVTEDMPDLDWKSLRHVRFLSESDGYVLGDDGFLLETCDGGETWQRLDCGQSSWLRSVFAIGGSTYIASSRGLLVHSEEQAAWKGVAGVGSRKLTDVFFANSQLGWVTDFEGEVLETRDGAATWHTALRVSGTPTTFCFLAPDSLFLAMDNGRIYHRSSH